MCPCVLSRDACPFLHCIMFLVRTCTCTCITVYVHDCLLSCITLRGPSLSQYIHHSRNLKAEQVKETGMYMYIRIVRHMIVMCYAVHVLYIIKSVYMYNVGLRLECAIAVP